MRRGFTLLETLLTLALLLVIVGLCVGFTREARAVRAAVLEEVEAVGAARLIMDRLTAELRAAVSQPGLALEGRSDAVRFACSTLPPPSVWASGAGLAEPAPAPVQDVRYVRYGLVYDDSGGEPVPVGVERRVEPALPVTVVEPGDANTSSMTAHLRFVSFRYWDGTQWLETWSAEALPPAVEIRLGLEPLPVETGAMDYPHEYFRRVVAVPLGRASGAGPAAADEPEPNNAPPPAEPEPQAPEEAGT